MLKIIVICTAFISCKAQQKNITETNAVIDLFLDGDYYKSQLKQDILILYSNNFLKTKLDEKGFITELSAVKHIDSTVFNEKNRKFYLRQLDDSLQISDIKLKTNNKIEIINEKNTDHRFQFYGAKHRYNYFMISKPLFSLDRQYVFFMYSKGGGGGYNVYKKENGNWTYYRTFMPWIE